MDRFLVVEVNELCLTDRIGLMDRLSGESKLASSGSNRRVVLLSRKRIFLGACCDDKSIAGAGLNVTSGVP